MDKKYLRKRHDPNLETFEKYQREVERLEQKVKEAFEKKDWSAYNEACCNLYIKRQVMEECREHVRKTPKCR